MLIVSQVALKVHTFRRKINSLKSFILINGIVLYYIILDKINCLCGIIVLYIEQCIYMARYYLVFSVIWVICQLIDKIITAVVER